MGTSRVFGAKLFGSMDVMGPGSSSQGWDGNGVLDKGRVGIRLPCYW